MTMHGTALVTGGGRGIGRAIAESLAAAGMTVALIARSATEINEVQSAIAARGGSALAVTGDVTDAAAMAAIGRTHGPIDLLVNNAGLFSAVGPVAEVDAAAWLRDITVNIFGVFSVCQAVLPGMLAAGSGRIINMAGGGTAGPIVFGSGYASSKAAVMRFTECLSGELSGTGVTTFALDPGLVRTQMNINHLEGSAGQKWFGGLANAFEQGDDVPPTLAAAMVLRIADGRLDALAGHLIRAIDNPDHLERDATNLVSEEKRLLRVPGNEPI